LFTFKSQDPEFKSNQIKSNQINTSHHIVITGTEDECDVEIYEEFQKLNKEVKKLSRLTSPASSELQRLVICHREMYNLGKSKNASPLLLYEILGDGFMNSVKGYMSLQSQEMKEEFKNNCMNFAKAAGEVQKLFGFSVPENGVWQKRQNFDKWIKDYCTNN
jgi:hypothetical protein